MLGERRRRRVGEVAGGGCGGDRVADDVFIPVSTDRSPGNLNQKS